jgi:hypothetical protein
MKEAVLDCDRNGKLQQQCWLSILHQAVGRGGEIKLQDLAKWMWHPKYEVLDIGWSELKLLEKYAMPIVPHKKHFINDFYHCLGSFWSIERGLFRSGSDQCSIGNFHSLGEVGVSKKMTALILENLPPGCSPEKFSAKSTRRGLTTEL